MQDASGTQQAMAEWGRLGHSAVAADLARFAALGLSATERLAAISGLIAAATAKRHLPLPAGFLSRIEGLTRPAAFVASIGEVEPARLRSDKIADALRLLDASFDRLAERLAGAGAPEERIAAVEAVLLARLLAAHRPHLVRLALLAAAAGLARPDYRPGDLVSFIPSDAAAERAAPAAESRAETALAQAG